MFPTLLYWRHPELGLLSPSKFLPVAEEIGVITYIDEWVLRNACVQARAWQESGYKPIRMTINLSTRQFAGNSIFSLKPDLVDMDEKSLSFDISKVVGADVTVRKAERYPTLPLLPEK